MLTQASLLSPAPGAQDTQVAAQLHRIARTSGPFHQPLSRLHIAQARTRRSRNKGVGCLHRDDVLNLLHVALFDTENAALRPYPAAGGIYAVHVYLLVRDVRGMTPGLYYVRHADAALERIAPFGACLNGELASGLTDAPFVAILMCDTALLARKYLDRAQKFALLEAGALVQTMYLAAESLGLSACAQGGMSDRVALQMTQAQHALFACCMVFGPSNS